ncbi:MAG: hypothetical protein OEM38_00480 [Gammaproteobacteria bacterium]|nr:hypothetical protein [Gammaproteobacteria bacterium]
MMKRVKVNADIGGKKAGDEFNLEFNGSIPLDEFWRRRFKDSRIDNCIEIVTQKKVNKDGK